MPSTVQVSGLGINTQIDVQDGETLTAALKRGGVNCQSDSGQPLTIKVNGSDYSDGDPVPDGARATVTPAKLSHGEN